METREKENTKSQTSTEECCPKFHPEKWDEKTFHWDRKPFIMESVPELFHIPYPPMIANKVEKMMRLAEESDKLEANMDDVLMLFNDPHAFRGDIYLSVTGDVPEANNVTLSGTFMSKVYEGDYKSIPKFFKEMDSYLSEQNQKARNYFIHYAYCPKCAEREGHNYMVFLAEVEHDKGV